MRVDGATRAHATQLPLDKRVCLAQGKVQSAALWSLVSADGFIICGNDGTVTQKHMKASIVRLGIRQGHLTFNGNSTTWHSALVSPINGTFVFGRKHIKDQCIVTCTQDTVSVVQYGASPGPYELTKPELPKVARLPKNKKKCMNNKGCTTDNAHAAR